ncbi:hypothetical protein Tco_1228999 [Tanacetum coccineum]
MGMTMKKDGNEICNGYGNKEMVMVMEMKRAIACARESNYSDFHEIPTTEYLDEPKVCALNLVEFLTKRTIGTDAAYALSWWELLKLMTKVYCLRNEIQKMETELWNLSVKNKDMAPFTYTQ